MHRRKLKIMVLGLRGFPGIQGGVETHAENLYPVLVEQGCDVEVVVRSPYMSPADIKDLPGIRFTRLWSPHAKGLEAIVHTFLGVLYAAVRRPDILHIHAIGPAILTPLARVFGLRVVVTHHGPDYDREKWGGFASSVLRAGERFGMRWSNRRIVISKVIQDLVANKHDRDCDLIPNGVVLPELADGVETLAKFGLSPGRYVLLVSRLVAEKRHLDLIAAFEQARLEGWKLALVGWADHRDAYVDSVLAAAEKNADIVCTGIQTGGDLAQLYSHAGLFVLPSSHEGLPIALLEALSYGLSVVASDIPANLETEIGHERYFSLGDVSALAAKLRDVESLALDPQARQAQRRDVAAKYDWKKIGASTHAVYLEASEGARAASQPADPQSRLG